MGPASAIPGHPARLLHLDSTFCGSLRGRSSNLRVWLQTGMPQWGLGFGRGVTAGVAVLAQTWAGILVAAAAPFWLI